MSARSSGMSRNAEHDDKASRDRGVALATSSREVYLQDSFWARIETELIGGEQSLSRWGPATQTAPRITTSRKSYISAQGVLVSAALSSPARTEPGNRYCKPKRNRSATAEQSSAAFRHPAASAKLSEAGRRRRFRGRLKRLRSGSNYA